MANILVVIELDGGRPLPVSLEVLGQGRRLSTRLGATLYAVVPIKQAPRYGEDDVIAVLSRHGADKVVLITDENAGGALRWGTHGPAIAVAAETLPPSLMLFGATGGAREVAPRSAARMSAAFLANAWVEVRDDKLQVWEGSGADAVGLDGDLEFPVVATVPPGRYPLAHGADEAEVEVMKAPERGSDFDELGWEADPGARPLVLAPDAGEARAAAEALAKRLGGEVAARPPDGAPPALVLSLGPGAVAEVPAEVRVAVGDGAQAQGAHYQLAGDPAQAARALEQALAAPVDDADKEGLG